MRFAGADGSAPNALTVGADGNLYGTTLTGGISSAGTVFQVTLAGGFASVYSFPANANHAAVAPSQLALGTDGLLYGMAHLRLAVTQQVEEKYAVPAGEFGGDRMPDVRGKGGAVHEHDRRTGTEHVVGDALAVEAEYPSQ
jgi:uncharacterized repeat protein (TIGR03803 family)